MTRRRPFSAARATDREVGVVAAVLVAASEKAAAFRLSHSTVKHHLANPRSKVGVETTAQLVWASGVASLCRPAGRTRTRCPYHDAASAYPDPQKS